MKTQLLANGSPSLLFPLGLPRPSTLVQPSPDSLPASFSSLIIFPKALLRHQFFSCGPAPQLHPMSPSAHAQEFPKHTVGTAGQSMCSEVQSAPSAKGNGRHAQKAISLSESGNSPLSPVSQPSLQLPHFTDPNKTYRFSVLY